jgi:hypothetical protein
MTVIMNAVPAGKFQMALTDYFAPKRLFRPKIRIYNLDGTPTQPWASHIVRAEEYRGKHRGFFMRPMTSSLACNEDEFGCEALHWDDVPPPLAKDLEVLTWAVHMGLINPKLSWYKRFGPFERKPKGHPHFLEIFQQQAVPEKYHTAFG